MPDAVTLDRVTGFKRRQPFAAVLLAGALMPGADDVGRPRGGVSIAAKVLIGFLVVLGAVLVPTYLVLRAGVRTQIREAMLRQLDGEATALAARLGAAPPDERPARIAAMVASAGSRVTVISPDGVVLGDSQAGDRPLDNHRDRPEVAAAVCGDRRSQRIFGSRARVPADRFDERLIGDQRFFVASAHEHDRVLVGALRCGVTLGHAHCPSARIRKR